jgi:hypothetical protein
MSVKPWDLLNPNEPRSEEDLKKERLAICVICPEYISRTDQCKKCGCIMRLKTKLKNAECPLGKW